MMVWIISLLVLFIETSLVWAEQCTLVGRYENNSVPVYRTSDRLVTFQTNVDVNTDGALQSYKIDDPGFWDGRHIQTNSALNTICNGVNIRRPNNTILYSAKQCVSLIREFKRIRDFGWLRDGENYVDFYAIALQPGTERPGNNRGIPCEKDGYYVSQVARAIDPSKSACDPERWVDALRIPAIVLPLDSRMSATGVRLHDLAIVRLPNSGRWVGAIIGDTNPSKIGEATVITNMRLRGTPTVPANYRATVALALGAAQYVVFPGTVGMVSNLSNASDPDIQAKTQQLFDQYRLGERPQLCP
jgi:hypothetical protein